MPDFLETLANDANETINEGYYNVAQNHPRVNIGFKESILRCEKNAIVAEIKIASPSRGIIAHNIDVESVALMMQRGGAVGLSVVTEPRHFRGRIEYFTIARKCMLPRLMKDIIIDPIQTEAAAKLGAEAILLIESLFEKRLCNASLEEMINLAHRRRLEVLLETHTKEEFEKALSTEADLIGINNRDLSDFRTDLEVTRNILDACDCKDHIVVSESGMDTGEHIRFLRKCGVRAFLVGSSIISSINPEEKVRELVEA
ncbi:MAG: indole-3-glycerol-phosphate synthase [Candidatus Bathyarchaeota archaeon]|jgi:indole-3-glycerol phosphate synthase|nr:indole-3-glycerol-phosphate synthase [Candidatus Bathyarchaeota archaeon]